MGLFKRAHIRGMVHELTRRGIVSWPTKLAEEEAADAIADELPEETVPEVTDEEGLTPEQAQEALQQIVEVAEEISEKTGGAIYEDTCKFAAESSYEDVASAAAITVMEKAAEETAVQTGPMVPGSTTPQPELGTTAEAEIDAQNTPSADLVVPMGTSEVDTAPGAVGQESIRPDQPGAEGTPPNSEASKVASPLASLQQLLHKMSVDGASLSGGSAQGQAPTPRVDLDDNLLIPGAVARAQGQTSQDVPAAANIGVTKKQPAGTPGPTAATPNKPAQDAVKSAMATLRSSPQGQLLLQKISEEMVGAEAEKEAQVATALQRLAQNLG